MSCYTTFLVGGHRFRVPFPKLHTSSEIFWALNIDYSQYKKMILGIFVYLFMNLESAVKLQHVLFENKPFLHKKLFISSTIPLYIGKNPVEKLCEVLKMQVITFTPVSLKFILEKIKLKFLHYIQHDFIHQCTEVSKDQISMFKSLVINYFIL